MYMYMYVCFKLHERYNVRYKSGKLTPFFRKNVYRNLRDNQKSWLKRVLKSTLKIKKTRNRLYKLISKCEFAFRPPKGLSSVYVNTCNFVCFFASWDGSRKMYISFGGICFPWEPLELHPETSPWNAKMVHSQKLKPQKSDVQITSLQ